MKRKEPIILSFTIPGQCPSKSNGYRVVNAGGRTMMAKSHVLKVYEQTFFWHNPHRDVMIKQPFAINVDVYLASNRPDLDNSLKIILDCLQQCRTIENDRYCYRIIARKFIDRSNPRTDITIITNEED